MLLKDIKYVSLLVSPIIINIMFKKKSVPQVREERKQEEKKKKKAGAFATPNRRGRADDLRRQTLMDISNASASSRAARAASLTSSKAASVRALLLIYSLH